ncbi:hypothetical protein CMI38_05975 [Candidatus Pacearchaeota archaeon]|jgi:hypothetical protein|nr:hypothetical protein [Candidatus Pacearchaeota archaeon]|tara:strand:+ start:3856 stop:4623 length:768 start_codon:yes stop_codon:yes gene_type:complete
MNVQHQFIDKSFSTHQLEKMKQGNSASNADYEFLTQSEFDKLRRMCLTIEYHEKGKVSNYKGFSADEPAGQMIQKMLNDRLVKWIGPHNIDFFAFNEAIEPWKIHADLRWHETKIPYKMVLVPMDVEAIDNTTSDPWIPTYTIAFDQRDYLEDSTNTGESHAGNDGPYATTGKTRICDKPGTHHLKPGYHITHEEHEKYMSHFPYDHLDSLTIDNIFEWKPRSAGYWDNNQMHCADNFIKRGIKTKKCLMICTLL